MLTIGEGTSPSKLIRSPKRGSGRVAWARCRGIFRPFPYPAVRISVASPRSSAAPEPPA